jgi:hypothetical protein
MRATAKNLFAATLSSASLAAAEASFHHAALHGGGGHSASARFHSEASLTSFAGGSFSNDGSIALHEGHAIPPSALHIPLRRFAMLPQSGALQVPFSELIAGIPGLAVEVISPNTPAGGAASIVNGAIQYSPPPGVAPKTDSIPLRFVDSFGQASTGTLVVQNPAHVPALISFRSDASGLILEFRAAAGTAYLLQRRSVFAPHEPWLDFPSAGAPLRAVSDAGGLVSFTIPPSAQTSSSRAFFRLADEESLRSEVGVRRSGSVLHFQLRGIPNSLHKLQARPTVGPESFWSDYPSARAFTSRAGADGFYSFSIPVTEQSAFFRSTLVQWE